MKQVTINVPEKKMEFFLELIDSLGFSRSDDEELVIPEAHKKIVRERMRTAKPGDYVEWDTVKDTIKFN